MIVFPNCKINIGLFITKKREDGYHQLESVFAPVGWTDVLEVNLAEDVTTLKVSGIQVTESFEQNIVYKAFLLMKERFTIGEVNIHLLKHLPSGAGLGGGSADASFALKALNDLFNLQISSSTLKEMANQLGADCPFFIENKTCFVTGKGDELEEIDVDLSSLHVAIVKPSIHVNTKSAFEGIIPKAAPFDLRTLGSIAVENWKDVVTNDFEMSVGKQFPIIGEIKRELYQNGAIYASMSGSGSAVYGIFRSQPNIHSVTEKLGLTSAHVYTGKFL